MTHHYLPNPLPEDIFCCSEAEFVDTRNSDKPYHDPNRPLHDAIYKSFTNFTQRVSAAHNLRVVQAQKAAEARIHDENAFRALDEAVQVVDDENDVEMTLLELIRSYNPDQQVAVKPPPSPEVSPSSCTKPWNIAPHNSLNSNRVALRILNNHGLDFDSYTPLSSNQNSMSAVPGQSFSALFNNGAGVVPELSRSNKSSSSEFMTNRWSSNNITEPEMPMSLPVSLLKSTATTPFSSSMGTFQAIDWKSPLSPSSKFRTFTPTSNRTSLSSNWRSPRPASALISEPLEVYQPTPWKPNPATKEQSTPPPFVPQRVLSPSNLINNPLNTSPPPPYAIHVTSRVDFGQTDSHRYFACPADFEEDWPEVSLLQWFASGVGFDFRAEKWDHKCLKHGMFYRMTLRPNLAMRDWGLGKGMEEVQKMTELELENEKLKLEPMDI